jgi:DNA (cytosine-5)-methyltransferase 1
VKCGSLFSGIGGLDLGLEQAGIEVAWQCEIDPWRREVLARHWPGVERFDDVRDVGHDAGNEQGELQQPESGRVPSVGVRRSPSSVDLICAGVPCQDVSVAGRRAGLAGERTGLFFEFVRILGEIRPRWFLFENVPGLLSSPPARPGADFAVVLGRLAELGYGLCWRILDSRFFGVPQRRRRVYVVGCLGRPDCAAAVLFEPQGGRGDSQKGRETGEDVAYALTGSPRGTGDGHGIAWNTSYVANPLGEKRLAWLREDSETYALAARESKGVSKYESQTNYVSVRTAQTSANGWGISEGETHTLDGASPDAIGVGATVRRLTPTECERLQSFPDSWTAIPGATDGKRYAGLGDAVTVNVAEWLGRRIEAVDAKQESRD